MSQNQQYSIFDLSHDRCLGHLQVGQTLDLDCGIRMTAMAGSEDFLLEVLKESATITVGKHRIYDISQFKPGHRISVDGQDLVVLAQFQPFLTQAPFDIHEREELLASMQSSWRGKSGSGVEDAKPEARAPGQRHRPMESPNKKPSASAQRRSETRKRLIFWSTVSLTLVGMLLFMWTQSPDDKKLPDKSNGENAAAGHVHADKGLVETRIDASEPQETSQPANIGHEDTTSASRDSQSEKIESEGPVVASKLPSGTTQTHDVESIHTKPADQEPTRFSEVGKDEKGPKQVADKKSAVLLAEVESILLGNPVPDNLKKEGLSPDLTKILDLHARSQELMSQAQDNLALAESFAEAYRITRKMYPASHLQFVFYKNLAPAIQAETTRILDLASNDFRLLDRSHMQILMRALPVLNADSKRRYNELVITLKKHIEKARIMASYDPRETETMLNEVRRIIPESHELRPLLK